MKTYTINGVQFSYNEEMTYLDFFIAEGSPRFVEIKWDAILQALQDGVMQPIEMQEELVLLDRWINDVPRKKFYRKMRLDGFNVLTGEYLFEHMPNEEAEDIFTKLENSAAVARRFLETFLPEVAEQCKSGRHPAAKHYIDP